MTKIIFVCQAPGRTSSEPLDGAAGRRLAALAGLDLPKLLARFERVNLLPPQPKDGKGDAFDLHAARARADKLREGWAGRKAVLLGRGVAAALRLVPDDYEWFKPLEIPPGVEVACMPHLSGISTWWNDDSNVEAARLFMQRCNVGYFALRRGGQIPNPLVGGRPELFKPEQVEAAIRAADGIMLRAAEFLSQETGIATNRATVTNYCERYPALGELRDACKQDLGDIAEMNIMQAVRAGNAELSLKLLRSKAFAGRGYELMVEGRFRHEGGIEHRHSHLHVGIEKIAGRLTDQEVDVLEGVYRKLAESLPDAEEPEGPPQR